MALDRIGITLEANTVGEDRLKSFEDAINRMSSKAETASKASSAGGDVDVSKFGQQIKEFIESPLQSAGAAAKGFLESIGPIGATVSAIGVAALAGAAGIFKLASSFADLYEQQANNSIRLGVTIRDYSQLAEISQEAGLAQDSLVITMKGLSKALADSSEEGKVAKDALDRLGVAGKDVFGAVRPIKDLLFDIADHLGAIHNPAQRAELAIKILGKGGLEVLPLMNAELRNQVNELEKLGFGWTATEEKIAAATDKMIDTEFTRRWNQFKKDSGDVAANLFLAVTAFSEWNKIQAKHTKDVTDESDKWTEWDPKAGKWNLVIPKDRILGPGVGSITDDQLSAGELAARKTKIQGIMGFDLQRELSTTKADLDRAIQNADVEGVRKLSAEYKRLEQAIKDAAIAAKEGIFQVNEKAIQDANRSYNNTPGPYSRTTGGRPSLLRPGELLTPFGTVAGSPGAFMVSEAAMQQANQGLLSGTAAQSAAYAAGILQRNTVDSTRALSSLTNLTDFSARRAEASSAPGFEIAAAQQAAAIRLAGLEQAKQLGMDGYQVEVERARILQDAELRALDLTKQRIMMAKQEGGQLFDALTAGGAGISRYVSGLGLGFGRTAFSNVFAELSTGLQGKFSLPGQGTASNPNFLGRILQGTPFGIDQNSAAGAVQMTAAQIQLQAATMMSGAVSTTAVGGLSAGGGLTGLISKTLPWLSPAYSGAAKGPAFATSDEWYQYALDLPNTASASRMSLGKGIGIAGAAIGGAYGAYSGFSSGGAQGITSGIGSLAGAAGAITSLAGVTGPLAPILMGVGLGLGFVSTLYGDPKKKRADQLSAEASDRAYTDPTGTTYARDAYGRSVDYGANGAPRVFIEIKALDSQSIIDRQADISEAVRQGLSSYAPLTEDLRATASYR